MRKKGEIYKFTCLGLNQAGPDFALYNIKEDNGDYDKYLETHRTPEFLQKNTEYEATVIKRVLYKDIKVITVIQVGDKTLYKDEHFGVYDPPFYKLVNLFRSFIKKRKIVH